MTDGLLKRLDAAFQPDLFVNHFGSSEIYTFTVDQNAVEKPGSAGRAGANEAPGAGGPPNSQRRSRLSMAGAVESAMRQALHRRPP